MNYYKLILLTESPDNNNQSLEENIKKLNYKLRNFADLIKNGNDKSIMNDYLSYIKEIIFVKKKRRRSKS